MCDYMEITSCKIYLYVSQLPNFMEEVNGRM